MWNRLLPRMLRVLGTGWMCCLTTGSPVCKAQLMTTGAINGTVADPSGATVPGATVAIRNTGTGTVILATSNPTGSFSQVGLPPGSYEVTVTKTGFSSFSEIGIYVEAPRACAP